MAPQLQFDVSLVSDPIDLISRFTDSALASPYRSTVPLLALVKDDWPTFQEILALCGLPGNVAVALERTVHSPRGIGRPSYTDAMVLSKDDALAIEAKWTEPRYPSVAKRLARDDSGDGDPTQFVRGWVDLLQPFATRVLQLEEFANCVYQVVHRAASACGEGRAPTLAYLHFVTVPQNAMDGSQYIHDLTMVHELLGSPRDFPFYYINLLVKPTRDFVAIQHMKKGTSETGRVVKSALRSHRLFEFGKPSVHRIGGASNGAIG